MAEPSLSSAAIITLCTGVLSLIVMIIQLMLKIREANRVSYVRDEELANILRESLVLSRDSPSVNHHESNIPSRRHLKGSRSTVAASEQTVTRTNSFSDTSTLVESPLDTQENNSNGPQSTATLSEQAVKSSRSLSNASTLVDFHLDHEHAHKTSLDIGVFEDSIGASPSEAQAQTAKPQHKSK